MKSVALFGVSLLFGTVALSAAAPPAPGQPLTAVATPRIKVCGPAGCRGNEASAAGGELMADASVPPVVALHPNIEPAPAAPMVTVVHLDHSRPDTMQRVWIGSIVAVIAASAFDAATSWDKQESNPLLASSDGTFGPRGLAIKAGIAGAILVPQLWLHKRKSVRTGFTVVNFTDAAVFTGASIHNLNVSKQ